MIVCSCNVLRYEEIFSAAAARVCDRLPTVSQVYSGLGCRAQCGQCAPTIKSIRDEAHAAMHAAHSPNLK